MTPKISAIVTNWNGRHLLQRNLPAVIKNSPQVSEIIIIDNGSSDGSVEYLDSLISKFNHLKIIKNPTNEGFSPASNKAVNACSGDLVVLLNNDIFPHPGYLDASIKHFSDPTLFGVSFSETNNENYAHLFWKDGYIQYTAGRSQKTHISGWVSGGGSIVNRKLFLHLGGFDHIYFPFYSEDMDLGYRAWKSGYRSLWEPKSIIDHRHESSTSRFPKNFSNYVKERNRLLAVWRNITDKHLLLQNRLTLISRVALGPNYIKIIMAARRQVKKSPPPIVFPQLTDKQIFKLFEND